MDPLFRLDGKVALVTGGSRGLGREMVLGFARRGADVIIASRKLAACEELAEVVRAETGQRALAIAANVSDWDDCDALAAAAVGGMGHVDVLVNNAGLSPLYRDLVEVTEALWDKTLNVNLRGPFRLSALLGRHMADRGSGSIINVSSLQALRPTWDSIPYSAAKAGLNSLTESFAQALGPGVRVNGIVAGPFRTDIAAAWDLEKVERAVKRAHALQRVGEPEEVVGAAVFLASDAAAYCSGTLLRLDGGAR
jgi:NAD(P)-dependent dehydrogenase (short-subunit alcohol dehydrogenase family)